MASTLQDIEQGTLEDNHLPKRMTNATVGIVSTLAPDLSKGGCSENERLNRDQNEESVSEHSSCAYVHDIKAGPW